MNRLNGFLQARLAQEDQDQKHGSLGRKYALHLVSSWRDPINTEDPVFLFWLDARLHLIWQEGALP